MFGPGLIALGQSAEHFGVGRRVFPRGDDESTGLLVVAGRCPACRFKKTAKDIVRNRLRRESAGAPALANQVVDRVVCAGGFLHSQLSEWLQRHLGKIAARLAGRPGEWLLPKSLRVATHFAAGGTTISTSRLMLTSSPTTTPPASRVLFQATPKSWRLILVEPETAVRCKPQGSLMGGLGAVTSRTACLVTPRIVRSPVILSLPGPADSTLVDLKAMIGYLATSKKSELMRCLSRSGSRVSTVVASMVTLTEDLEMSASSTTTVPLSWWNSPRTVEIMR